MAGRGLQTYTDMNKRMQAIILATLTLQPLAWGQVTLRDAFANAPDSIFPLLTRNNRLDCLDFAEGNVTMEVNNLASGQTRIDSITHDYLRIQMTPRSRVELRMLQATEQMPQRICMIHTCMGPAEDSHVTLYGTDWTLLGQVERPKADEFIDDSLEREARGILTDLSLMRATFSEGGDSLIWTMPTTEFNKAQRKAAEGHLHSVTTAIVLKPADE